MQVVAEELKKLGVDDPYAKKLKGITDIEKSIGKGKLDNLTEKPEGKPTLVSAEDKRPAITNNVQFSEVGSKNEADDDGFGF